MSDVTVSLQVNGRALSRTVDSRTLLVELIREHLQLAGTRVGCDSAQCGCCTVLLEGNAVKSCSMLAIQANGKQVTTVEGLASGDTLHPVQQAFRDCHGLQCGYCTAGMVMATIDLLKRHPKPTDPQIRAGLEGNICRCTGYVNIVRSVQAAAGV